MVKPAGKILSLAWKHSGRTKVSGDLLELEILEVKGLSNQQRVTIQFVDQLPDGKVLALDAFDATLELSTGKWIFTDLQDHREEGHPAKDGLTVLTDHVKVLLPGMANPLHILFLPDTDETFSNIHQVGVKVQDDKGEWVGLLLLHSVMCISPYKKVGQGGMLNHFALQIPMYAPVQDIIPENDSYWKKQQYEMEQQVERYSKNLKEYVDQLLEDPDSPFLVDLTRIREYRELASEMEKVRKQYDSLSKESPYYSHFEEHYRQLRTKLEAIEQEHNQYLDISKGIPNNYVEQAKAAKKHKERCAEIDAIADSPLCMAICCLPLGGLVEGGLQILKGNYWQGILAAGLDVMTFGGFTKIHSARRLYKAVNGCSKTMRGQLFEARYMRILLDVGEQEAMKLKGLNQLMGEVNPAAKAFGSALLDLKGVMGSLHDIKTLLGNKKKFEDSLELAQKPGYKDWLPEALKTTDQLLVWGGLRALANSYKLYDDVNKLTELEDKGIAIRAHMQADLQQLKGLFGDRLASQWNHMAEIIQDLSHADPAFFADEEHGLLYNGERQGRDFHGEWLVHVEESRKREHLERRGLLTQKSAADLRKDIALIEKLWQERVQDYQDFCRKRGLKAETEGIREKYAVNLAGKSLPEPLDLEKTVIHFLDYFEGLVKMCIPEIHSQSGGMPRFWVHFLDCVHGASGKKVSVVKRIYPDNFRSTCEEQIQVMYGE